jgi:hypothetical protein
VQLGLYLVITVVALLALRIVLQAALLYEEHDDGCPDEPVLCGECEYVVPDMAFCAHCGMAANASSLLRGPRGAWHAPCSSTRQPQDRKRHPARADEPTLQTTNGQLCATAAGCRQDAKVWREISQSRAAAWGSSA